MNELKKIKRNFRGHFVKKTVTAETRRLLASRYGCEFGKTIRAKCAYCDVMGHIQWFEQTRGAGWVSFSGLEIDHIRPEYQGGTTTVENLTLACRPCNRSKASKTVEQWKGSLAA